MRSLICIVLVHLLYCPFSTGQSLSMELDSLLQAHHRHSSFEGVVLISEKGTPTYQWSCGFSNRDSSRELTIDTHFPIGDITKHITAILIFDLIENGNLKSDSPVNELLPQLKFPKGLKITVEQLLKNTSGLPRESPEVYHKRNSPRIVVERALKQTDDYGKQGTYRPNNIDYILLGMIVAEKSGRSFRKAVNEKIIEKLDLKNTGFLYWDSQPEDYATGYHETDSSGLKKVELRHIENYFSSGAMYSNAMDLMKIDWALQEGKLLNQKSMGELYALQEHFNKKAFACRVYKYPMVITNPMLVEISSDFRGVKITWVRLPESDKSLLIISNMPHLEIDTFGLLTNLKEQLIQKVAPCGNEHIEPCR